MSRTCHIVFWVAATLALELFPQRLASQELTNPADSNSSRAAVARPAPPPLPVTKAPVALFRELLAMNGQDRMKFLAKYSPESQKSIQAKISEYKALTAEQCELRLRVTELRYYLLPLMSTPSTNRTPQLDLIPVEIRPLIEIRLQRWDALPAMQQKNLLENEAIVRYLADFGPVGPIQPSQSLTNMPSAQRGVLDENLKKWQQLSETQRQAITRNFEEFFGMTQQEKTEVLTTLSETERRQIEKTLLTFNALDRDRRIQCMRALGKFSRLTPSERLDFLKNAERWTSMSPSERKAWRALVFNISQEPPLPPGLRSPVLPPVPPPPVPSPPRGSEPFATNR